MLERLLIHWPLKLLALVLAFGIWVSVTGEQRVLQDFDVPLDVQLPDDLMLTSQPPNTVTVRLRGTESRMRRLDNVAMEMTLELPEAALGEQDLLLGESNLSGVPVGIEVDFVHPDRLQLVVDRRARRELTVEPVFLGQPPEGFAFYGARVRPQRIRVEGPEEEVIPLQRLATNPIRLDTRRRPFSVRVAAVPDAPHVRVVDPRPLEVRVEVDVAPIQRTFEAVPVELTGAPAGSRAEPGELRLVVSGPPALVQRIGREQLRVLVEAGGLMPGTAEARSPSLELLDVPVEDLPRISAQRFEPRTVTVRVPPGEDKRP